MAAGTRYGHPGRAAPGGCVRPEQGLLAIRKGLGLYANLRPVAVNPRLLGASTLRPEVLAMGVTSRLRISPLGAYHALMYGRAMYFDVSKARRLLGWSPRYSNTAMFCQSYDWYLAHREEVLGRTAGSPHTSAVKQGVLRLVSRVLG